MTHPIRVLHLAETIRGGVATVIRHLMEAQLSDRTMAACHAVVPHEHASDLHSIPSQNLITFARSGRNLTSLWHFGVTAWRALRHLQPTVVHLHSTFAGFVVRPLVCFIPRHRRPRVVYCPHAWAFMMAGSPLKQRLYAMIERLLLPLTDTVICVSTYERDLAQQFGLPTSKMVVIYNGVPAPKQQAQRAVSPLNTPLKALFVGRLDYQKGFDILQAVMEQIPAGTVQLQVIGEAVQGAAPPAPQPGITYLGWQTPAQVAAAMQQAEVLVMPSRWEGFAMVPLEAMTHSCAVLASNVCSLPEVVRDGETGLLVPPNDAKALAQALTQTSRATWHALGQQGRVALATRFTLAQMLLQTTQAYQPTGTG